MPNYKQENRPVRIRTPFGEDVLLVKSLAGAERLGRPFQFELVLASEGHELDYKKIIGQNVTVFVDKGDKEPRFFNGYVSRFAQTKFERDLAEYHATVVPWLWFLTRSSDCRIFQNQTIPEILKQVFVDHGFSDIIDRLHGSYRKWDYCVQYRETAYDFVSRLMEEEGIYYYFKHEAEKHSMVLCDSPASHKQFAGYEDLLYRPSSSTVQETLTSWVVQHEVQTAGYVTADFDFTTPRRNPLANSFRERSHSQSQLEQFDYLGEQSPFSEGERYSKLRLEERQAQHETYSGEGDARGICTGVRFVLKGHPRKEFEKEYLTTGAEYLIHCNTLETAAALGDDFKYHSKMTAMLLDDQFRTPRVTPKPIVHGPQTAIVVGPASEKIYTDEYGRVKVQFHWDRRGNKDENSSCWMRVSQAWAGKPKTMDWGDMAIPHIGDEVIVECLEGDPDRPIITGRVYNQANMPPLELPANKDKRIWRDDFGNQMVFDATEGDEHIRIYSPHHESQVTLGRSITQATISDNAVVTVGNSWTCVLGTWGYAVGGACFQAYAGVNLVANLGFTYTVNLGAQYTVTAGYTFAYTADARSLLSGGNANIISKKSVVIGAAERVCAVGGSGKSNSAVFNLTEDGAAKLEVGASAEVEEAGHHWYTKCLLGSAVVFPLAAAGLAAACGEESSQWGDKDYWQQSKPVAVDATFAAGMVSSIIYMIMARRLKSKTSYVDHGDDAKARFLLENDGTASLRSMESILIGKQSNLHSGTDPDCRIILDTDGMLLEAKSGDLIALCGESAIGLKPAEMSLSATSIKATGNIDLGSGALTIMGGATPVSTATFEAAIQKIATLEAAQETSRKAIRDLEIAQLIAELTASLAS